jgi:hypothetical protein
LNRATLTLRKKRSIPASISVSFQTSVNPVPLSITFLIISIKYVGGIRRHNHWRITGIFSIGKINPDNSKVGSKRANADINMATTWLLLMVEIIIPIESATVMNNIVSANNRTMLPRMGSRKIKYPNMMIMVALIKERRI